MAFHDLDIDDDEIPAEVLNEMFVTNDHFLNASQEISPAALREFNIEIPDV